MNRFGERMPASDRLGRPFFFSSRGQLSEFTKMTKIVPEFGSHGLSSLWRKGFDEFGQTTV